LYSSDSICRPKRASSVSRSASARRRSTVIGNIVTPVPSSGSFPGAGGSSTRRPSVACGEPKSAAIATSGRVCISANQRQSPYVYSTSDPRGRSGDAGRMTDECRPSILTYAVVGSSTYAGG
jgi:hypothetical protein